MEPIAKILYAKPGEIFHRSFNITPFLGPGWVLELGLGLVMSQGIQNLRMLSY